MNFALAIVIYLISFITLLWAFSRYGMGLFSALTITALISGIILLAIIPPSEIEHEIDLYFSDKPRHKSDDYIVLIYLIIMVLTLLLISFYIIMKAYEDRHRRLNILGEDYLSDFNDYLNLW